jgi:hypothetical protein
MTRNLRMWRKASNLSAIALLGFGVIMVSACSNAGTPPEAFEIANMRESNFIPKTSPTAFVNVFNRYCVSGSRDTAAIAEALKLIDYVALRETGSGRFEYLVVDSLNPLVTLSQPQDPYMCAVTAESRAGQTNAVDRYIAANHPNAVPLSPKTINPTAEQAWLVGTNPRTIILTLRDGTPSTPARFTLMILTE